LGDDTVRGGVRSGLRGLPLSAALSLAVAALGASPAHAVDGPRHAGKLAVVSAAVAPAVCGDRVRLHDFKTGEVDVDFGDGLTPAPTAGRRRRSSATRSRCRAKSGDSSSGMKAPLNLRSMFPEQSPKQMARNPLAFLQ
jgi:hypothetical protein